MAESSVTESKIKPEWRSMPVRELAGSTRQYLASMLDADVAAVNENFQKQNWEGLADLMNFSYQIIKNWDHRDCRTKSLLEAFSNKKDATVGKLLDYITQLERYDIIEDIMLFSQLERSYSQFLTRQEELGKDQGATEFARPVQVHNVDSSSNSPYYQDPMDFDQNVNQYENMVTGDVNSGKKQTFDAYVSYCEEDLPFVKEMIETLEKTYDIKLCVDARDLLVGSSKHFVTAQVIAQRCRKVILVMSPSFLRSSECEFQVKIALALSPGAKQKILIPIMFRHCTIPLVLQHLCLVDYSKSDLAEWFWYRLAMSLKESRSHNLVLQSKEMFELESVKIEFPMSTESSVVSHETPASDSGTHSCIETSGVHSREKQIEVLQGRPMTTRCSYPQIVNSSESGSPPPYHSGSQPTINDSPLEMRGSQQSFDDASLEMDFMQYRSSDFVLNNIQDSIRSGSSMQYSGEYDSRSLETSEGQSGKKSKPSIRDLIFRKKKK